MKLVAGIALVLPFTAAVPISETTSTIKASCGIKGYDSGTKAFDTTKAAASYASCGARCQSSSKCVSFAFGSGYCYLYSKTVYVAF